ncbi:MAG: hypothetical protein ACK6DP_09625 [Gemmatimonas sp.]|uniref:hypothetical protein n=1 Tax=Gemmatimonas sp. TaxID=1962908 RepID=UPI00391EFEDD|nr:hypothetical protein [Gemmatimonadota bacterium]
MIIAIGTSGTLAMAFITAAWRGHRAGRQGRQAESVALAADEVLADAQRAWRADSLWTLPPGTAVTRTIDLPNGVHHDIVWRRSHPLVAWLDVRSARISRIAEERAGRRRTRALWLAPPSLPLPAALTASGAVIGEGATTVSGIDIPHAAMPCGMQRDAVDVAAIVAGQVAPAAPAAWPAMPVWAVVPPTVSLQVSSALPTVVQHSVALPRDSLPAPLPASPGWQALLLDGPVIVVQGPTVWRGLLTVRGALRLQGPVQIDGVLLVRGPLDAQRARLRVRGAVLVADSLGADVRLGGDTDVQYDRCAVQMALATVATPRSTPFVLWQATGH